MNINLIIFLISTSVLLRIIDCLYYRDSDRMLCSLGLKKSSDKTRGRYYKKYDHIFCVFPFLWSWIDIFTVGLIVSSSENIFLYIIAIVFVGGRFRALQEAGHTAVHSGLCKSKKWQWLLSDLFFQYPCFKPDMYYRQISHVHQHHKHPNEFGKDPNIDRLLSVGFIPGISKRTFYLKLLHPLTFAGFSETIKLSCKGAILNHRKKGAIIRIFVIAILTITLNYLFGIKGLLILYIIPLLTTYPLFSWISLLVEHRWFVHCTETNRYMKECINCRPTDYKGIIGWVTKHLIFPGTDQYHLVHSLYPFVRWNYMKRIDLELKKTCPHYIKYQSEGLIIQRGKKPSALSELRDRVTLYNRSDLACWADNLILNVKEI